MGDTLEVGRSVVATAPVRIADVGGWTDTWFGAPGRVCHVAVGPGVRVDAEITADSGVLRLVAPGIGIDREVVSASGGAGALNLLDHAVAAVLDAMPLPAHLGIDLTITSAVPPGASLGTSASVLVATIGALDALVADGTRLPAEIAVLAHEVET